MKPIRRRLFAVVSALFLAQINLSRLLADEPLPSWNEGPAKRSIIDFVQRVTTPEGKDFTPVAERIAVFDCDGTLMSEQPMYSQLAFVLDRVDELAPQNPQWKNDELFKAVLERRQNPQKLTELLGKHYKDELTGKMKDGPILKLLRATHSGMTNDEFQATVKNWLAKARHPRFQRPYTDLVFQPMLEVLQYLRENGFKTYIVSGSGKQFLGTFTQQAYGIPPEQVVGSQVNLVPKDSDGKSPDVLRGTEFLFNEKENKVKGIEEHIVGQPIMAFGNSDGDFEMLEWTTREKSRPRFGLLVHHTDPQREFAYDRDTKFGRLDQGLIEAPNRGWTVADMRRDWKRVYPFDTNVVVPEVRVAAREGTMNRDLNPQNVYCQVVPECVPVTNAAPCHCWKTFERNRRFVPRRRARCF